MNISKSFALIAFVLLAGLCASVSAGAKDFDKLFNKPAFEPGFYVAAGFDYRTDERPFMRTIPSLMVDFLFYPGRVVAFKAGVGYNDATQLGAAKQIRTRSFDAGIRFQDQRQLFSPYMETGYQYMRYLEKGEGLRRSETRPGWYFAIGMSAHLSASYSLDITLKQVANFIMPRYYPVDAAPLPDDIGPPGAQPVPCGYASWIFGRSLYNPATLEIQARFKL